MNETYKYTVDALSSFGEGMRSILFDLANRLGEVVSHLYIILVRHQMLIGLQNLILALCFFIGTFIVQRQYKKIESSKLHEEDKWLLCLILVCIGMWMIIQGVTYLNISLPYLLNPEYHALMQAKEMLKEIK